MSPKDASDDQFSEVEQLVRSVDAVPPVSPALRQRVLVAASQAGTQARRERRWVIVASLSAVFAACVLLVAVIRLRDNRASGDRAAVVDKQRDQQKSGDVPESVNPQLHSRDREILKSGMLRP